MLEHRAGEGPRDEEQQKPSEPALDDPPEGRSEVLELVLLVRVARGGDGAHREGGLRLPRDEDVDDVVDRHDAERLPVLADDRHGVEAVLRDEARDLLLRGVRRDGDDVVRHQLPDLPAGLRGKELPERRDADEPPLVVDGIEVGHGGDLGVDLPEVSHRLGDAPVGAHLHEAVGHQASGGPGLPGEKAPRGRGVLRRHPREDREAPLLGEEREEPGGVVGLERVERLRDLRGREPGEAHSQDAAAEVREDDSELLLVQLLEDGEPVLPGDRGEEVGDVGRVELEQPLAEGRGVLADDLEDVGTEELSDAHRRRV